MSFDRMKYPKKYSLGVVYPAKETDLHGDSMQLDELEKAAWKALGRKVSVGLMHRPGTSGAGTVVESYIYRGPKWTMKDVKGNQQVVDPGDWLMGVVWNDQAWNAIMNGQISGF